LKSSPLNSATNKKTKQNQPLLLTKNNKNTFLKTINGIGKFRRCTRPMMNAKLPLHFRKTGFSRISR